MRGAGETVGSRVRRGEHALEGHHHPPVTEEDLVGVTTDTEIRSIQQVQDKNSRLDSGMPFTKADCSTAQRCVFQQFTALLT